MISVKDYTDDAVGDADNGKSLKYESKYILARFFEFLNCDLCCFICTITMSLPLNSFFYINFECS